MTSIQVSPLTRMVAAGDSFFEKIAKDVDVYRKWVTGRSPAALVRVFTLLHMFYSVALGKSEASRTLPKMQSRAYV